MRSGRLSLLTAVVMGVSLFVLLAWGGCEETDIPGAGDDAAMRRVARGTLAAAAPGPAKLTTVEVPEATTKSLRACLLVSAGDLISFRVPRDTTELRISQPVLADDCKSLIVNMSTSRGGVSIGWMQGGFIRRGVQHAYVVRRYLVPNLRVLAGMAEVAASLIGTTDEEKLLFVLNSKRADMNDPRPVQVASAITGLYAKGTYSLADRLNVFRDLPITAYEEVPDASRGFVKIWVFDKDGREISRVGSKDSTLAREVAFSIRPLPSLLESDTEELFPIEVPELDGPPPATRPGSTTGTTLTTRATGLSR